nr:DNA-directed DNA polymerase [Tanacetum cinerariifolium]
MRTRNFYFLNNSSATILRRQNKRRTPNVVEPELRTIVEMTDNRTMEKLLQARTKGYGEAIVIPKINAGHFEIKTNLLQLVQANPYHGFERENPHTHINNFKRISLTLKFRDVPNDVINLMMFSYSLEGNARVWYDKEPPNSVLTWEDLEMLKACPHHGFTELTRIDTFYNGLNDNDQDSLNAATGENLLSKTTREALQIIENKSKVRYSRSKPNVSRMNTTSRDNASKSDDRIDKLADQILTLVDIFAKKIVTPAPVKAVEESCVTCGEAHAYYNCPNTDSNQPSVCVATGTYNQVAPQNRASSYMAPPGFAPNQSSTSGTLPSNTVPNPKGEMKAITTRSGVAYEGPSIPTPKKVVEQETEDTTDKEKTSFQGSTTHIQPPVTPIPKPDVPKTLPKPNIPYPLRLNDQKLYEKATNQMEKFFQIFQDLHFDISFADLSLPELTPTRMTLELADRSITRPKGVAENVFVKVGKFHFLTDFVVVDFEADPRVPLILGRSFLRTGRALIDVYGEEITLRVNDEVVTFNLNQTTRHSSTYDDLSINRIDIIDVAREEYAQEILGYSSSGNPTSTFEPILSDSSPFLTRLREQGKVVKAKYSIEETLELELKELPSHLKYAYLEGVDKLPVIISKDLKVDEKEALLKVVKSHKWAIAWKITHIKCIDPRFCTYKILMEEDYKPAVQSQRWVNPKIHEVIKKEVIKFLDAGMIYPISNSPWVSPIYCVPKKGITVVENENNELIPTRLVTSWRVCINYKKLNDATRKPFMDQMLERLARNEFYCFLDGFSGYFRITINPPDQKKTTFTCPYGTFAYRRMPFGLSNAPVTFQRCTMAIFHDMIEKTMEVFMDDFSVFGDSFSSYLSHLDTMLQMCEDTNLVLNWKKCHFMVKEGIFLDHKNSKNELEVDRSKVDVIAKLPYPTNVKGVSSFLGHASFYRRFIQDFSKIARPLAHLLEKETPFVFSKDCIDAFETLKKKLTEALILVVPDWNLPFELMCDDSDFAIGVVLGQRVCMAKKLLISSKLVMKDPPVAIMVPISPPRKTAYKSPIGCTPYKLVYEKSCHLPIELEHKAYWALKHVNFDLKTEGDHRKLQLNKLNELRDQAYENSLIYKEKTKKIHDSKIKNRIFNVGDRVLHFNSRLKIFSEKLKTRWSGPFTITKVFPYGTVELSQPDGPNFKVNGHRVKHYFGGDVPQLVVPDLQTFPMDK